MNEQGRGDANGRGEDEGRNPHLGDPREPSLHTDDSAAPDLPAPAAPGEDEGSNPHLGDPREPSLHADDSDAADAPDRLRAAPGDADAADALDRLRAADPAARSEPRVAGIEAHLRRRLGQFGEEPNASGDERDLDALASRPFGSPLAAAPDDVAGGPGSDSDDEAGAEAAGASSLDERRDRRRPTGAWLAAAAAIAIAAGGGGYLLGNAGDDGPTMAGLNSANEADASQDSGDDAAQGESDLDGDANRMTDENGQGAATDSASQEATAAETYAGDTEESLPAPDSGAEALPEEFPESLSMSGPAQLSPPPVYEWAGEESLPTTPEAENGDLTRLAPVVQTDEEFAALAERLGLSDNSLAGDPGWEALVDSADPAGGGLELADDGWFVYSAPSGGGSSDGAVDAIAAAEAFGEQIGLPADTVWEEAGTVDDDVLLNGHPAVSVAPVLTGIQGSWVVQVDPTGEVTEASGPLVQEEALPPEPIISPAQALDRLNDPEFGAPLATFQNPTSSFSGEGGVPWADPEMRSPTSDAPLAWDRPVLDLTEYSLTTSTYTAADGLTYLVPAYEFSDPGVIAPVIALTDEALGLD